MRLRHNSRHLAVVELFELFKVAVCRGFMCPSQSLYEYKLLALV